MAVSFYLSYARADASPQVKRFFDDLSDTIKIAANLPRSSAIGFYDEPDYQPTSEWSLEAEQALLNSQAMICLLSPAYFHDLRAGKEWQAFDTRRRLLRSKAPSLAQIIIPVCWSGWHDRLPEIINDLLMAPNHLVQQRSIKEMLNGSGRYLGEYAELLRILTHQLIDLTSNYRLPVLDHLVPFKELNSLFHLWAEVEATKDETNGRPSHAATDFIKNLPLEINLTLTDNRTKEPVLSRAAAPEASRSRENASANFGNPDSEPARVLIIEDDEQQRKMLEGTLSESGFVVQSFEHAQLAADKLFGDAPPDLCVVDMQLPGEMQGIDFIKNLIDRNDLPRPSIIATSGTPDLMEEAIKAGAVRFDKPYDIDRLVKMSTNLAIQGKLRRLFNPRSKRDRSREKRPVFLSFSSDHRRLASSLKSHIEAENIGVWYSRDLLYDDDLWPDYVSEGIDKAKIFLAFITEGFLLSDYCRSELNRFHLKRMRERKALLLPIFYSSSGRSEQLKRDPRVRDVIDGLDCIDLSGKDLVDGIDNMVRIVRDKITTASNGS